jgi:hypothetical protein
MVILDNLAWLYSTLQIFASPHALQNFSLIIDYSNICPPASIAMGRRFAASEISLC